MQTVQIDKLGASVFDGTTLLNPAVDPVTIQTLPAESRTVITIPAGVAVGQFNIGALLGIPSGNAFMIHDIAIGGTFGGNYTGGSIAFLGPLDPNLLARPSASFPLVGTPGIGITDGPRWLLPEYLLAITTVVADTGPYRVVLLVEKLPNQKLMASVASGMIS